MIENMEHSAVIYNPNPQSICGSPTPAPERMTRDRKRMLLLAGALGLISAGLIAITPEIGLVSAVASLFTSGASAVTTIIAKR